MDAADFVFRSEGLVPICAKNGGGARLLGCAVVLAVVELVAAACVVVFVFVSAAVAIETWPPD